MTIAMSAAETFDRLLREGAGRLTHLETPLLDARILLKSVCGFDDAALIANGRTAPSSDARDLFFDFIDRRAAGEPVAYITGEKEFWSLRFKVDERVLVPRADSEALIEAAVVRRDRESPLRILDLGVGSGCLLCALLTTFPNAIGVGVDRSRGAVLLAGENVKALALSARASLIVGDWLSAVGGKFDIIVSNPPYIRTGDRSALPRDVSAFEPGGALFAGEQGLDSYKEILNDAPNALRPGGLFILESGDGMAQTLCVLAEKAFPGEAVATVNDLKGIARAIVVDLAH